MSAAELVSELAAAGVELWEEDGRIRFRAPQGALTEELRERLRADRDVVLAYLRDPFAEPLVPDPDGRHLPFPLTEVQSSYLLGRTDAFPYGGIGCHAYLEYELPGDVAPERAAGAWRALVERHDALRTVYHPDGQQVLKDLPPYDIPVAGAEEAGRIRGELAQRTYDPGAWPLFDVRLTHSPERLLVHLSVDLLVTDFSGVQQLLGELEQLCLAPDRALESVPVSFRDHVLAERRLRDSARWARDRAYWLDRLDDLPPAPELPVLTEESGSGVRFRRLADRLTAEESAALRRRAAGRDLTVSTVMLAAYAEVIGRWSAKPRFTLNLPVFAKRPVHPDIGRVVGDFTSVTLLAVEPDAGKGFADRARVLGGRLFEDLGHGLFSGVEVLREATRRSDRQALMPVVFTSTLQGTEVPATGPGRVVYGVTQTPQVWIDCQVMESGGEILLGWDVREGVLPEGLADDAFGAFAALVRELAVSDALWDSTDPVRVPEAQAARHAEVNATGRPLPEGLLHERVFAAAATHADRPAVIAPGRTLTYAELAGYARAVAARLRAAGVAPGDRVAIVMDKGWEQVPAVLGALDAGCVYVPVDTVHPPARRAKVLASSGAVAVLTQAGLDGSYEVPTIAVDTLELSEAVEAVESRPVDPGQAAYIIYTSGSTGEPKGVVVSHRAALNTVADIDERFGVGPGDRVLGLAQLGFDLSVYDLFGPLAHGGAVVLPDPERRGDPSHWADLAARHRVTLWNSVPAQLQMLYDYLASGAGRAAVAGLAGLRLGLLSGDWIPVRLPDRVRELLPGLRLISLGGATEAAIWSIHHPIEQPVDPDRPSILYGRPLANQTFHVLDEALRPRPDWVPGELFIGGSGLALGYHGDPETTARRFVTHPVTGERLYRTGDLGRWLPSGDIEFLGREDGQVKIRGHRIELAEIEAALTGHPAVGGAAVLAVGDDPLQRRLVAFAEPARVAPVAEAGGALARRAREAADAFEVAEPERVAEFARLLDEASLASMLDALRARGLFTGPGAAHTADEVAQAAAVPRHHRLVRRWLRVLHADGVLTLDAGRYRLGVEPPSAADAWDRVAAVWSDELGPRDLLDYLRANADQLDALMDDRVAAVDLLFPAARMETADAAYRENVMSAYLNRVVAEALRTAAEERTPGRPLRVLEVGAGTGASTAGALAALDGREVEWLFTDVSPFFLDKARERFGPDPRLRYGLYDVDRDPAEQGLAANSFDAVVCAGVLNNARDTAAALTALRSLLVPGGLLLVTEPTREHYEILISQAFMMTGAEDLRRADGTDGTDGTDATFVTREQWLRLFAEAGGENTLCLPEQGHALEPLGQHVFAVRFKTDRAVVDPSDVLDHLATRLPVYMLPAALHVLDALPLTSNGKVDRKALAARAAVTADEQHTAPSPETAEPADELEERLASVAAVALGVTAVPRDRSLFDLGADSLLLAQLSARLIEEVPQAADQQFDTLLRELLNRPTVADLARHLRGTDDSEAGTGEASALLPLGDAPDGGLLHVLVHEGIGTMAPYRDLTARLSAYGPLVGLAVGDVEACTEIPAEEFVERLAAEHVRRLTATGAGRFRLTGYCLGGQLATEIARQLTEGGAHVERLTVVSSSPPAFVCEDELLIEHAFARVLGADPAAAGYPDDEEELGAALRAVLDATPGRVPSGAFAALCGEPRLEAVARRMRSLAEVPQAERLSAIARTLGGDGDAAHVPGLYRVFRHAFAAASLHTTQPYAGDITLVQPRGRLRFLAGFGQEADELWREVCLGDLTVVEVDGDHFSCLRAPHVDDVASAAGGTP